MLTIKKHRQNLAKVVVLAVAIAWINGCAPPGPSALLEGKRLIEQGKYAPAIEKLKVAVSLLGTNALAWNYLGLAYHHAGQPANALEAYQKALKLNHDLVVVHYNLGCLYLDQNKPNLNEAARDELYAFALHQGNSLEGRLKLGTAQLRLGDLANAETSFREGLRLSPQSAEAMNDLGIVQMKRNHARDAVAWFEGALKLQPNYPPALLNLAVALQTSPNSRALALQKYQEYLALNPRPENWEVVSATARQLELELNPPPPVHATPTNVAISTTPPPAPRVITNVPAHPVAVASNPPKIEPAPVPKVAMITPKPVEAPPPAPQPEAVHLSDAPIVKPADDAVVSTPVVVATPVSKNIPLGDVNAQAQPESATATKPPKRGFLQRINPANLFHRDSSNSPTANNLPASVVLSPAPNPAVTLQATGTEAETKVGPPSAETISITNRYQYHSPAKPAPGNRLEAERLFSQALQAQQEHRTKDAVATYRQATQADPSFFEAQSNLGLAAYDAGEMALSLSAHELALAIVPNSFTARFNFALALKKANYLMDAAQELERLLVVNTGESPAHLAAAHLMLANLYSEQFHQPSAARRHYLKVLELDPKNSQATAIRYWLRDNP